MDADDIALPGQLSRQFFYLENHKDMGILGTSFFEIDEHNKVLGEVYLPVDDVSIRKKIYKFNPFLHSSVIIRREALDNVGFYNENFQYAQDYELWFKILKKYKAHNLE